MRYLNSSELSRFHDAFLAMCEKRAARKTDERWGFPGGIIDCDTYSFNTEQGTMYIGHSTAVVENRWWIPVGLQAQRTVNELTIAFEVNIPRVVNMRLSVHFAIDDNNSIHILHKGKVTARHSLRMDQFFAYYRNHSGRWPVIRFSGYNYLELGSVSIDVSDDEFLGFLESLAGFANYVPEFKDNYR